MSIAALDGDDRAAPRQPRMSISLNGRAAALLWVVLFCGCMVFVYIRWLYPHYWYMGFPLGTGRSSVLWLASGLILLSASTLPTQLLRLSDFILWMLFYFVYAPSMLFVPLQGLLPDNGLAFVCSLTLSFLLMQALTRTRIRLRAVRVDRRVFVSLLFLAYIALNLYVMSVFAGSLKLAGIAEIYAQRSAASDLASGSLVGYASGVLSGALNPFLMAVGLTERRKTWLWLGIVGQIFVYATAAMKSVLMSGILAPIFYYFLVRHRNVSGARLGVLIMASCIAPLVLIALLDDTSDTILWQIVALIFMRTYGMTGALSGMYADFFTHHPHTWFSHVNVVAAFVHYPYQQSLGQEVGVYMVGTPLDANANFWATDGTAAIGNAGIVLMGVIAGAFLILANALIEFRSRRLAFVAFIPFVMTISNTSLFTALLSGGGGLLLLMIFLWQARAPQNSGSGGLGTA